MQHYSLRSQEPILFATDKQILDLVESSKKKLTASVLRNFLIERGILTSEAETRPALVDLVCRMPLDYRDVQELLDLSDHAARRESYANIQVSYKTPLPDLEPLIATMRSDPQFATIRSILASHSSDKSGSLELSYTTRDYSKTELRQVQRKKGCVELEANDGVLSVRFPANEQCRFVAEKMITAIIAAGGGGETVKHSPREVDFSRFVSKSSQTVFFSRLINELDNFVLSDVIHVLIRKEPVSQSAFHSIPEPIANKSSVGIKQSSELITDDTDTKPPKSRVVLDDDLNDAIADDMSARTLSQLKQKVGKIDSADLRGSSLLDSDMYNELEKQGFFIASVRWESETIGALDKRSYLLEAGCEESEGKSRLSYKTVGVRRQDKYDELAKTYRPPKKDEEALVVAEIERLSMALFDELTSVPAAEVGAAGP